MTKVVEFDVFFLSYDEPHADVNYADLCNKVPWAKRIHGVKGSDHAHQAAAEQSETDWVLTVDADNIVDPKFFDLDLDMPPEIRAFSWCGRNNVNGLRYGNGGLKLWHKDHVLKMKTHENADSDRAQVDFCWEEGYRNFPKTYSETIINPSPFIAWRAGFREGVKMTLDSGLKVPPMEIEERIWWHNLHRLRMWSTVGAHIDNGLFAIYGARLGTHMTNCTDWDHIQVRDFEILRDLYNDKCKVYENNPEGLLQQIEFLGKEIKSNLGLHWPDLDATQSRYVMQMYEETIRLGTTYYSKTYV